MEEGEEMVDGRMVTVRVVVVGEWEGWESRASRMEVPSSPRPRMRMCCCGFEAVVWGDGIVLGGWHED